MVDQPYDRHGESLREITHKYEMLNDATRERIREISERLGALSGEEDAVSGDGPQPAEQN